MLGNTPSGGARAGTEGDDGRMSVALGMPALPPPVLAQRRSSRKITLRHRTHPIEIGGDAPISVQSLFFLQKIIILLEYLITHYRRL